VFILRGKDSQTVKREREREREHGIKRNRPSQVEREVSTLINEPRHVSLSLIIGGEHGESV